MIKDLFYREVQDYIFSHENDDERALVLKHKTILGLPASLIAEQIRARKKARTKLPLWYCTPGVVYPPGLNLEQSSSEKTALFKAEILSGLLKHGTLADVTGGFGVDSFFFSKIFKNVCYVEPNASLLESAKHNHEILGVSNIAYHNRSAEDFIKSQRDSLDCIFIDPSRRTAGKKVFRLTDCEPDVSKLLPEFFIHASCVLIKTSSLLDIQQGIQDLKNVEKIWVVAVDNECKELLFMCRRGFTGEPEITAVNLQDNQEMFSFINSEEKKTESIFSEPQDHLYEPNAAILKAGAFKLVSRVFNVTKLHPSTHFYTSAKLNKDFPGRIFKTIQPVKPDPKKLREVFSEGKANIITRNYPLTVAELKKKTKLIDGGELYLLGFSGLKEKHLIAAERIK